MIINWFGYFDFFFCKTSSSWLQFILKFANKTKLARYKNNFQLQIYIFLKPLPLMCYPQISLTLKQGLSVLDNFWDILFNCVKHLCRVFIDWAWLWLFMAGFVWFWLVLADCGWFWIVLVSVEWFWLVMGSFGWWWVVWAGFG